MRSRPTRSRPATSAVVKKQSFSIATSGIAVFLSCLTNEVCHKNRPPGKESDAAGEWLWPPGKKTTRRVNRFPRAGRKRAPWCFASGAGGEIYPRGAFLRPWRKPADLNTSWPAFAGVGTKIRQSRQAAREEEELRGSFLGREAKTEMGGVNFFRRVERQKTRRGVAFSGGGGDPPPPGARLSVAGPEVR